MQTQASTTPRRRGRPRKHAQSLSNQQFTGVVLSIASKPRLRPGVICEVHGSVVCLANNGKRVVIEEVAADGLIYARALDEPLATIDHDTGTINAAREWHALFSPQLLYRIGHLSEDRHHD